MPTPEAITGTGIGNPNDNIATPMRSGAGTTFGTARSAVGGGPPRMSSAEITPPPPSPEESLMASLARIEARFVGLDVRQERTEDAMAVLMSTRDTTGPRRIPSTPVQFEPARLISESTGVPPVYRLSSNPRTHRGKVPTRQPSWSVVIRSATHGATAAGYPDTGRQIFMQERNRPSAEGVPPPCILSTGHVRRLGNPRRSCKKYQPRWSRP